MYPQEAHQMSVHEGIDYPCDQCDHKATRKKNLKRHKIYIHESIEYKCDLCDKFIKRSNLKKHNMSVHEGMNRTHKISTHRGKNY